MTALIPTFRRPGALARCLRALAAQDLREGYEVVVGVDGGAEADSGEVEIAREAMPAARVVMLGKLGPAGVRNALLREARGEIVLWLNDDVAPRSDCLRMHVRAHEEIAGGKDDGRGLAPAACREREDSGTRCRHGVPTYPGQGLAPVACAEGRAAAGCDMVVGASPWRVHEDDTLFDRVVRETSMIFFYDRMDAMVRDDAARARSHDWGFRHAWTLNLSVRRHAMEGCAFDASLPCACFEDLEWAHRMAQTRGSRVLYRPEAIVEHDHRIDLDSYLRRERMLGREAFRLATLKPACARAIFGRDVASADEVGYATQFVERERGNAERIEEHLRETGSRPAGWIDDAGVAREMVRALYEMHLPLKRRHWRMGLVEAADAGVRTRAA
ncbi:MAG: glycosyltransferase [Phycisphaerales bacterium]|jgi:glycosyltransferase involved in cell wall biosynthesis|nr:glycosyltransferase [Phycisphaerales bacterium]